VRFFFQAEDGIRDFHVTGVQTCALPIYRRAGTDRHQAHRPTEVTRDLTGTGMSAAAAEALARRLHGEAFIVDAHTDALLHALREIGRASCRERVATSGAGAAIAKTSTRE